MIDVDKQLKWDIRFLEMAKLMSTYSKDPSTKTGAVLVKSDNTVQGVGFNGFARRMPDLEEYYNDREEKYSRIIHAEINAMLLANGPIRGCTLYTYPFCCCDRCCVQMIQADVFRFVYPSPSEDALSRWGKSFEKSRKYFKETGVQFREIGNFQ
jgi:dCMP deaminase